VVRRVNHRAFVALLGGGLDSGAFVQTREELEEAKKIERAKGADRGVGEGCLAGP
jgi:hypothetical protein